MATSKIANDHQLLAESTRLRSQMATLGSRMPSSLPDEFGRQEAPTIVGERNGIVVAVAVPRCEIAGIAFCHQVIA